MTKITVIIPVYNVEKYIRKCLDSIINQTLKDIEIIIVNDGSPDNCQSIIDEYAKKDDRIISLIQENGRQGKARNNGLKHAKGEYISFIDSDDYIETNMLEKMYNKAKEEDSDIVICSNYHIYETTNIKESIFIDEELMEDSINNKKNKLLNIISPCYKIYKRSLLLNNNISFMEKLYYEDLAFSLKSLVLANKISYVNEPLYYYIIREGSTMTSTNVIKNLDIIKAFEDVITFLKNNKLYEKYYSEIEFMAIDNLYISTIVRVIRSNASKNKKNEIISKLLKYFNDNFNNYKKNKYLSTLNKNRKTIYNLINLKQYWMISFIFKIKN